MQKHSSSVEGRCYRARTLLRLDMTQLMGKAVHHMVLVLHLLGPLDELLLNKQL